MTRFEHLTKEMQELVPFRIKYKDESWEMQLLAAFSAPFCPTFLTEYTTVIGSTIYFPSREYLLHRSDRAERVLAHEVVHLLDAERFSEPVFMGAYLFPQILALGVLTFPLLGWWSLLFLLFLLPLPAPFRFYFESRAYAIDVLTAHPHDRELVLEWAVEQFCGWNYYKMFPFRNWVRRSIMHWVAQTEKGKDQALLKVLLIYEMAVES
ncbi:MAG: hypothetical protein D6730_23500 [Bacteroidetes bacterium]|nr:MAG: hypothetical protein D6730_23500 [Bacteroidota bacterium]